MYSLQDVAEKPSSAMTSVEASEIDKKERKSTIVQAEKRLMLRFASL